MACENPMLAVLVPGETESGKKKIKILGREDWSVAKAESRYGIDNVLLLPCGRCPSCKAAHQKEWSVRCALEASYHTENCMITLTYDNVHRPKKLIKRDLQDFIKKMRNKGIKFRYFGCGEYGTQNGHPHYHLIMFGYWPEDAKFDFTSKSGYPVYKSEIIRDAWKKGIISVSEMSPGTAAYVAGYVDKKLGIGEFSLMSKRPGIGERYFTENLLNIYKYDNLVGQFGVAKVPRYCDKVAERDFLVIDDVKEKRKKMANSNVIEVMNNHSLEYKDQAVGYNARIMRDKLKRKKRL